MHTGIKCIQSGTCRCTQASNAFSLVPVAAPGDTPVIVNIDSFVERYSLLSSRLTALMSHVIPNKCLYPFTARGFNSHRSGVPTALFGC